MQTVWFSEKFISHRLHGKLSVCKCFGNLMSHRVCFLNFSSEFLRPKNSEWNERNLISLILYPSVCSSCLITFILVPTAATCPKVRNLVLCHLWLQPHQQNFPDQKPENEAGYFFRFQHSSTTHLENSNTHKNHLFSSYIYCAIFMLKGFVGGKKKILLHF